MFGSTNRALRIPSLHVPERGEDETFEGYRERRALSRAAAKKLTDPGSNKGPSARDRLRSDTRQAGDMGKRTRAYQALMTHFAGKRNCKPGNKRGRGLL